MSENKFVTVPVLEGWRIEQENGSWNIYSPSGDAAVLWKDDSSILSEVTRQLLETLAAAPSVVSSETVDAKQTQATAQQSEIANDLRELVDLSTWQQEVVNRAANALEASTAHPDWQKWYDEGYNDGKEVAPRKTASTAQPDSELEAQSPFMKEKAADARIELQRIKDAPVDAEERAIKQLILDGMSDPKCWEDGVAVIQRFGVQEFVKGYRAALTAPQDARERLRVVEDVLLLIATTTTDPETAKLAQDNLPAVIATSQPAEKPEGKAEQHCDMCGGRGEIGGFVSADSGYQTDPCPACSKAEQHVSLIGEGNMVEQAEPELFGLALNVRHKNCHKAADAFWSYWKENGETHKHGYYESTWGAINQAIKLVGVVPWTYGGTIPAFDARPPAQPQQLTDEQIDAFVREVCESDPTYLVEPGEYLLTVDDVRALLSSHKAVSVWDWIDLNDRMPEPEVFVLTWDGKQVGVDWWGSLRHRGDGVTHWLPFPKPPAAGAMYGMHSIAAMAAQGKDGE